MKKIIMCCLFLSSVSQVAQSWNPDATHSTISRSAIILVKGNSPEISDYSNELVQGSIDEDKKTFPGEAPFDLIRGRYHFFNPRTRLGLAFDMGLDYVVPPPNESSRSLGLREWVVAIQDYAHGDKSTAYRTLGRICHLLTQDASQPAHIHDDPHAPWFAAGGDEAPTGKYNRAFV